MYKIAIIGAGQLGSRHLQGLKRSHSLLEIWVMDPNEESLKIARERYEELSEGSTKEIHYVHSIEEFPEELNLAIISTSSKPRANITKELLLKCVVNNIILEKFLFPILSDYALIQNIFTQKKISSWVNCPRRMFDCYQQIKGEIDISNHISMRYEADNWGLCCNSIHYIDLFMYLTQEELFEMDLTGLFPAVFESKRPGYIELQGTIRIETPKGNSLVLTSIDDSVGENVVQIYNGDNLFIVDELNGIWSMNDCVKKTKIPYQSDLTGILIDTILKSGKCSLTTYEESSTYHKIYLSKILNFVNTLRGQNDDSCPIT